MFWNAFPSVKRCVSVHDTHTHAAQDPAFESESESDQSSDQSSATVNLRSVR